MTWVVVYRTVTPMVFGGLTRIPSLISRWHDGGRFNLARFLVLVVPGILILLQPIWSLFFGSCILFPLSMQTLFAYGIAVWTGATFVDCIKGNNIR
ncbi:hypothetical protein A7X67_13095 [Clostridium sp. W14A]|nr:hypothetical protein A7X67_13095 [Clostridium sp. W14A]